MFGHRVPTIYVALLVGSTLSFSLASPSSGQTPQYSVQYLGNLGGPTLRPKAVNDQGLVIGTANVAGVDRGWIASVAQPITLLPLPVGATSATAQDINEQGTIVGSATGPGFPKRAIVWKPSGASYNIIAIPNASTPSGQAIPGEALALNERGDVVGSSVVGAGFHWSESTGISTDLGNVVPGSNWCTSVNEARIAGAGPVRIDLTSMTAYGTVSGLSGTLALRKLNDLGEVAGSAAECLGFACFITPFRTNGKVNAVATPLASTTSGDASGNSANGIDLFADALYFSNSKLFLDVAGVGSTHLFDLSAVGAPGWVLLNNAPDAAMSPMGRIATRGLNSGLGANGVVLMTPKPFLGIPAQLAGANGPPVLKGSGTLVGGSSMTLALRNAPASSGALLFLGASRVDLPLAGGTLVPNPTIAVFLPTNANGEFALSTTITAGIASGLTLYLQAFAADPTGPQGAVATNALAATFP